MGIFDRLASRIVPDVTGIERDMASDPEAPAELLRRMAEREPKLWDVILANLGCPNDVSAFIRSKQDN